MCREVLDVDGVVELAVVASDFFAYDEAANGLRGERTGRLYRLTDTVEVQVSRVVREARRIEFRLVQGNAIRPDRSATNSPTGRTAPTAQMLGPDAPGTGSVGKRAAPPMPPELRRAKTTERGGRKSATATPGSRGTRTARARKPRR